MKPMKMKAPILSMIAMAVVGSASAQSTSTFTIEGNIDAGYKSVMNTDSTKNKAEIAGNNSSLTYMLFKGERELGDGMKASLLFELDPNVAQTNSADFGGGNNAYTGTPFNGETYVSLSGNFGQIKLGTPNAAALSVAFVASPFTTALGSGYSPGFGRLGTDPTSGIIAFIGGAGNAGGGRIIRSEKTAVYSTPVFNGFQANVELGFGNNNNATVANNTNAYTGLSLRYGLGALNAIYSYTNIKAGAGGAAGSAIPGATPTAVLPADSTVTWNMLAANYKLGALTVYGGYTTTKQNTGLEDSSSWNVAAKYAVTPKIDVLANYLVRNSNLPADKDATVIGLGANYDLGNKANLYVRWENLAFINQGAVSNVQQNTLAGGVRVQF